MSRVRRSDRWRETSAAYAASQPLFDALRNAVASIDEQRKQLEIARYVARDLHVKLAADGQPEHQAGHVQYVNAIVKASRMASRTFADVFVELAKITAAEPAQGKAERQGHQEFTAMGSMAKASENTANAYLVSAQVEGLRVSSNSPGLAEVEGEVDMKDAAESDAEEGEEGDGTRDAPKTTNMGKKTLWNRGDRVLNVPLAMLGSDEKEEWRAEKKRQRAKQRRDRKRGKRERFKREMEVAQTAGTSTAQNGDRETTIQPFTQHGADMAMAQPSVQFEDVSAEVDARLKAKEEARESKKKEKKRKRESGESFDGVAMVVDGQPSKKKSNGAQVNVGVEDQAAKKHDLSTEGDAGGGQRKRARRLRAGETNG